MTSQDAYAAAQELLKNDKFMNMFQNALCGGASASDEEVAKILKTMSNKDDPERDAWLQKLQKGLQEEAAKEAVKELEQIHSDENGQWMYILPTPGFCIKCTVGGGTKLFINVCQHERIGEPVPMTKEESTDMEDDELRFRIPLSCGQARPDKDKSGKPCKVYDVIVNTLTVKRCAQENEFRRFVAALCMQWIKQKYEPTLNADEFRNLNFKAKGKLEPQRIRLSSMPKPQNAMNDEIKLPSNDHAPTAPTRFSSSKGFGKLVEEMDSSADASNVKLTAAGQAERVVLASQVLAADTASSKPPAASSGSSSSAVPQVMLVRAEGAYDWSPHLKPLQNPFFHDTVPAQYYVELHLPGIQTIREVQVRVSAKKLECFHVDEVDDCEAEKRDAGGTHTAPFLALVFDYPVSEDVSDAKFVKKRSLLKMRFNVQLPDETADTRTKADKDMTELEEEEERQAQLKKDQEWKERQERIARQQSEEASVMAERKSYVENLSAVQSGDVPPVLREEVDRMPREQLPSFLSRIECRVRRGDTVDELLEKLPEPILDALADYLREKLSLHPREKLKPIEKPQKRIHFDGETTTNEEEDTLVVKETEQRNAVNAPENGTVDGADRVEYNNATRSEKLFGVAFHNRYLFALDQ